jgi:insulysin
VQAFARRIFEKCFCELLVHGNVTPDESIAVSELVESTLGLVIRCSERISGQYVVTHVEADTKLCCRCSSYSTARSASRRTRFCSAPCAFNPEERNSAIEVDYQIGLENVHENALLDLLAQVTNDASFYQLRTVEQLGYIVYSGVRRVLGAAARRLSPFSLSLSLSISLSLYV